VSLIRSYCSISFSPQDGRIELSLLEEDTGKEDVIPESLKLSLRSARKRKSTQDKSDNELEKK